MILLTPPELRRLEQAELGLGTVTEAGLIEEAGRAAADFAQERFGPLAGRRVVVLCGKGHNAADGLVAARHLQRAGAEVLIGLAFPAGELAPLARQALAAAVVAGATVEADSAALGRRAVECDLAIDALVGTGARLPLSGPLADRVRQLEGRRGPVLALDLPSGVDGESGAVTEPCVRATATLTFLAGKPGLFLEPGRRQAGGVALHAFEALRAAASAASTQRSFGPDEARACLPRRAPDAHKRQAEVLVLAGSSDYLGAALLCARGAYRGGAGLVRVALPAALAVAVQTALPEAVVHALPADGALGLDQAQALLGLARTAQAVVVGPGLGRREATQQLVRALWAGLPQAAVFDADALAALQAGSPAAGPRVLTPHEGELKGLMGAEGLCHGRPTAALALARAYRCEALLKGPATLVADPGGRLSINLSGGPALASAGTGDVLAGLIGALLAQGAGTFDAACLGAWAHGLAADRWTAGHAGRGLLASELADGLPQALAEAGA